MSRETIPAAVRELIEEVRDALLEAVEKAKEGAGASGLDSVGAAGYVAGHLTASVEAQGLRLDRLLDAFPEPEAPKKGAAG